MLKTKDLIDLVILKNRWTPTSPVEKNDGTSIDVEWVLRRFSDLQVRGSLAFLKTFDDGRMAH